MAAYAAAGLAGSDPFQTGNQAFRLGLGKALVPFVFVFAPSLLLMNAGFTWAEFALGLGGCVIGIVALSAAFAGWLIGPMSGWQRWAAGLAGILFAAPSLGATALGAAVMLPVLVAQRRAQAT
jgi:TRAP-type uncharacterized transport system fused permease subunit